MSTRSESAGAVEVDVTPTSEEVKDDEQEKLFDGARKQGKSLIWLSTEFDTGSTCDSGILLCGLQPSVR